MGQKYRIVLLEIGKSSTPPVLENITDSLILPKILLIYPSDANALRICFLASTLGYSNTMFQKRWYRSLIFFFFSHSERTVLKIQPEGWGLSVRQELIKCEKAFPKEVIKSTVLEMLKKAVLLSNRSLQTSKSFHSPLRLEIKIKCPKVKENMKLNRFGDNKLIIQ